MVFGKSTKYDQEFVNENLMGPNALKMIEELTTSVELHEGMKVLDLGCGRGFTSIFWQKNLGCRFMPRTYGLVQRKIINALSRWDWII